MSDVGSAGARAVASGPSAGSEALQALVSALGRSCDTNDWLSNTIGAVIGAVLAAIGLHVASRAPTSPARASR